MNHPTPTNANWQDVYMVAQYTGGSTFRMFLLYLVVQQEQAQIMA